MNPKALELGEHCACGVTPQHEGPGLPYCRGKRTNVWVELTFRSGVIAVVKADMGMITRLRMSAMLGNVHADLIMHALDERDQVMVFDVRELAAHRELARPPLGAE